MHPRSIEVVLLTLIKLNSWLVTHSSLRSLTKLYDSLSGFSLRDAIK